MKKMTKLTALLLAVLMIAVLPASVLAAETEKKVLPMSTFEEVKAVFPEADITDYSAIRSTCNPDCVDPEAVPVNEYTKKDGRSVHNLCVYADGSYIVYGTIEGTEQVTRSGYTYYYDNLAYYDMGRGAYMSFYYDYRVQTSTFNHHIIDYTDGASVSGDAEDWLDIDFDGPFFPSNSHLYKRALVIEDHILGWGASYLYTLGVRTTGTDIYVYRDATEN